MKSMVVYSSQSGNTRKLAEAVYETLPPEKTLYPISDAPEPDDYDVVAVGFWLQGGQPDRLAHDYLQRIGKQKVFLFATHGAAPNSAHAREAMTCASELLPQAEILGQFNCQGEVNARVLVKVAAKQPPPIWLADASKAVDHPDQEDIASLQAILRKGLAGN